MRSSESAQRRSTKWSRITTCCSSHFCCGTRRLSSHCPFSWTVWSPRKLGSADQALLCARPHLAVVPPGSRSLVLCRYVAVILSVTLILIFGEILPQAVCTGPNRLAIGAGSYYLVMCLQVVIYPLAWAIAKLLDRLLGTEESRDSVFLYLPREQLGLKPNAENSMALVELHGEVEAEISDAEQGGGLVGLCLLAWSCASKTPPNVLLATPLLHTRPGPHHRRARLQPLAPAGARTVQKSTRNPRTRTLLRWIQCHWSRLRLARAQGTADAARVPQASCRPLPRHGSCRTGSVPSYILVSSSSANLRGSLRPPVHVDLVFRHRDTASTTARLPPQRLSFPRSGGNPTRISFRMHLTSKRRRLKHCMVGKWKEKQGVVVASSRPKHGAEEVALPFVP